MCLIHIHYFAYLNSKLALQQGLISKLESLILNVSDLKTTENAAVFKTNSRIRNNKNLHANKSITQPDTTAWKKETEQSLHNSATRQESTTSSQSTKSEIRTIESLITRIKRGDNAKEKVLKFIRDKIYRIND